MQIRASGKGIPGWDYREGKKKKKGRKYRAPHRGLQTGKQSAGLNLR